MIHFIRLRTMAGHGLLVLLGILILGPALFFRSTNLDDLILYSFVADKSSPTAFFTGDWGLGNHAYRPLHSLLIWMSYRWLGVRAGFEQTLNLGLHLGIIGMLYGLLGKIRRDMLLPLLLAGMAMVSELTLSPATWVSDRPSLLVAVMLMLTLHRLILPGDEGKTPRLSCLRAATYSALALLGKESGLLVPLLFIFHAIFQNRSARGRMPMILTSCGIIAAYLAWRALLFGSDACAYSESGSLFARFNYADWSTLPPPWKKIALVENSCKNLITPFLPIFDGHGGNPPLSEWLRRSLIWLPTALLTALATHRKPSRVQTLALVGILGNSVIHFAIYRYRIQYLSQLCFCLYVAASPRLGANGSALVRRTAVVLCAVAILQSGIFIRNQMSLTYLATVRDLARFDPAEGRPLYDPRIHPSIARQVWEREGGKNQTSSKTGLRPNRP